MTVYLDTSAVLSWLLNQNPSIAEWGSWQAAYTSEICRVEFHRTIDRLRLGGDLDDHERVFVHERFATFWRSVYRVRVSGALLTRASQFYPHGDLLAARGSSVHSTPFTWQVRSPCMSDATARSTNSLPTTGSWGRRPAQSDSRCAAWRSRRRHEPCRDGQRRGHRRAARVPLRQRTPNPGRRRGLRAHVQCSNNSNTCIKIFRFLHNGILRAVINVTERGVMTLPVRFRTQLGLTGDNLVIAESTSDGVLLRPTIALPIEIYSDERVGEFNEPEADLAAEFDSESERRG